MEYCCKGMHALSTRKIAFATGKKDDYDWL